VTATPGLSETCGSRPRRNGSTNAVRSRHGYLSRQNGPHAELLLKHGELGATVATPLLELGIEIGAVHLVCQLGPSRLSSPCKASSPRSMGSERSPMAPVATTRDAWINCAALIAALKRSGSARGFHRVRLTFLRSGSFAAAASEPCKEDLFEPFRPAYPYVILAEAFDAILRNAFRCWTPNHFGDWPRH